MIVSPRRPQRSLPPDRPEDFGFTIPWRPRGPIAAFAGLAMLVWMMVFGTWALIHAAKTGEIPERHGWARLADDPIGFWMHVVIWAVCVIPMCGLVAVAIYSLATRRRSRRKVDAYLQRRADEGSRTSAMPRRLR